MKHKMAFYKLSESRILRVVRNPIRTEVGIAPKTIALMQRNDTLKRKEEIWIMLQRGVREIIISAWRYPGVTKPGAAIPMPEGLLDEILESLRI